MPGVVHYIDVNPVNTFTKLRSGSPIDELFCQLRLGGNVLAVDEQPGPGDVDAAILGEKAGKNPRRMIARTYVSWHFAEDLRS